MPHEPLQILHIARNPDTGVATAISSLAGAQQADGHDVSVVVLRSADWKPLRQLRDLPRDCYWSPKVFGTAAFLYHSCLRRLENWTRQIAARPRPLVLHYHNAWLAGALMFDRSPADQIAQVVTYHGLASEAALYRQPVRRAIHRRWAHRAERCADAIVSVDATTPASAARLFGVVEDRFQHIPNGTPDVTAARQDVAQTTGTTGGITIAHVGSVDEGKGWRITAEAVEQLRRKNISVRFLVAGSGPKAPQVEAWCRQRSDYCTYLGWVDDVPRAVLAQSDILSMPSRTEGMPMAALEAICMGVPVVCTRVGGLPEIIRHEQDGLLVDRTVDSVAAAFHRLSEDASQLQRMKNSARNRWCENFTPEIMHKRYHAVYAQALQERSDDARRGDKSA